jgi:hypothetical protein
MKAEPRDPINTKHARETTLVVFLVILVLSLAFNATRSVGRHASSARLAVTTVLLDQTIMPNSVDSLNVAMDQQELDEAQPLKRTTEANEAAHVNVTMPMSALSRKGIFDGHAFYSPDLSPLMGAHLLNSFQFTSSRTGIYCVTAHGKGTNTSLKQTKGVQEDTISSDGLQDDAAEQPQGPTLAEVPGFANARPTRHAAVVATKRALVHWVGGILAITALHAARLEKWASHQLETVRMAVRAYVRVWRNVTRELRDLHSQDLQHFFAS